MTLIVPERFALRRGTAAQWTAANPVLAAGEEGFETDTGKRKVGDGSTAWVSLTYSGGGSETVAGVSPTSGDVPVAGLVSALTANGIAQQTHLIYDDQPQSRFYHQERTWILGGATAMGSAAVTKNKPMCGTVVVGPSGKVSFDINLNMINCWGAAWGSFNLMTGVQSSVSATTPIWQQNNAQVIAAASGVTSFLEQVIGQVNIETISSVSARVTREGLTPGATLTWQIVPFIVGANMALTSAANFGGATGPATLGISPDDTTLWIPFRTTGVVIPVSVGGLPLWTIGLAAKDLAGNKAQWNSVAGSAITMPGTTPLPYACYVSPDGTKVAVCNYGTNTVTFINTSTKAIIGTSAAIQAGQNIYSGAWTADSSTFWAAQSNGKVYPITASSQAVGSAKTIGSGAITIVLTAAGTTGFAFDNETGSGTGKVYPLSSVTTSGMTVGSAISLSGSAGTNNIVIDPRDGTCWVSSSGKLWHCNASGIIGSNLSTGFSNAIIAISADGLTIWSMCGTAATNVVAFDTSTIAACLQFPSGSGMNLWAPVITSKGYVYYTDFGNSALYGFPGSYLDVGLSGDIPFAGNSQVAVTGAA